MILLALQFWEGDKADAMEVAKLIADLETEPVKDAIFLFSARRDCTHDNDVVEYVRKKFKTYTTIGQRTERGYPGGSNALWHDTMSWAWNELKNGRIDPIETVLTFEADACPTRPGWHYELLQEWRQKQPCKVLGHLLIQGRTHVNGNAMFDPYILRDIRGILGCSVNDPWDLHHYPAYQTVAKASELVWSMFKTPTVTADEVFAPKVEIATGHPLQNWSLFPALLHGVKDDSARKAVREKFLRT